MNLPPFLLDHWLAAHEFASPPIPYNLASSTGPRWTVKAVLALGAGETVGIDDVEIGYAPSEGRRELREAIGAFHGVDPDWVIVTTGASEAFSILLCLAAREGGDIVLPSPAFPAFAAMAGAWKLGSRFYRLTRARGFTQHAAGVIGAIDDETVLALVNSPHNPTGSVMAHDEIVALAGALAGRGIPLIVDEVYHPLYFGAASPSAAAINNVIVISDMSKALSLAGLRIGWIIDADAERRKRIIDARSYFTISSSPILEALAITALRHREVVLGRLREVATANLAALTALMEDATEILDWTRPAGGTIAFPWFRDGRNSRPFCETLAAAGVLVAPGDCFGEPDHLRIGFCAQVERFDAALAILSTALRSA